MCARNESSTTVSYVWGFGVKIYKGLEVTVKAEKLETP